MVDVEKMNNQIDEMEEIVKNMHSIKDAYKMLAKVSEESEIIQKRNEEHMKLFIEKINAQHEAIKVQTEINQKNMGIYRDSFSEVKKNYDEVKSIVNKNVNKLNSLKKSLTFLYMIAVVTLITSLVTMGLMIFKFLL